LSFFLSKNCYFTLGLAKGSFEIVVLTKNFVWVVAVVEELLFRKLFELPKHPFWGVHLVGIG
jgi:hypothetical protein